MKLLITESQYKTLLKEFMGSLETNKMVHILKKFSNENNIKYDITETSMSNSREMDAIYYNIELDDQDDYIPTIKQIDSLLKPYNWFISFFLVFYGDQNIRQNYYGKTQSDVENFMNSTDFEITDITLNLEKLLNINKKVGNTFYHVTDIKNTEDIMSNGLYPRTSKNKLFNYPERIYMANDIKTAYIINNLFKNPRAKQDYGKEGTVVLELNLPDHIKTYRDPKAPNSSYTLEPIHPKYIEIYDYNK